MVDGLYIVTNIKKISNNIGSLKEELEETERRLILQSLKEANGNKSKAAKLLDIDRTTLYSKIYKYNISTNNM